MKKRLFIALICSCFICKQAFATIDIMANIQTLLEYYKEYKQKLNDLDKLRHDAEATKKGMGDALTNCFKNPLKCNPTAFNNVLKDERIKGIRAIGKDLNKKDITKKDAKALAESVHQTIYQVGQKQDLNVLNENRKENNAVVSDIVAILFAKGVVTHQSLLEEDGSLYQQEFKNNNMDEILNAQNRVAIISDSRVARIMELRAYMISGQATAELTQQVREADE